jgi:hypothetical protein
VRQALLVRRRRDHLRCFWRAARLGIVSRLRDPRLTFAAAVAVIGAFADGQKGFPGNTGGIVDPGFLRLGIATICLSLLDDLTAGLM